MGRSRIAIAAVVCALALAVAACSSGAKGALDGHPGEVAAAAAKPSPSPPTLAPLTGLPLSDPSLATRPALAVKIDNHPDARPQSGLDRADIVYEELVEGNITRFVAVFQSRDAAEVGPVRSARWEDPDILRQYGTPILAYSGAANAVLRKLRGSRLVRMIDLGGPPFHRVSFKYAPHNLYTSTQELYAAAHGRGTRAPRIFQFGDLPAPPAATPWPRTTYASVPMSADYVSKWRYDAASMTYLRSQGSVPQKTRAGAQLAFRNVLLMFVPTRLASGIEATGTYSPLITLSGHGVAVLLRDGVRIPGSWRRPSLDAVTALSDTAGRPLAFAPGTTWVELVPVGEPVTYGPAAPTPRASATAHG
jgi:hypothetical protein